MKRRWIGGGSGVRILITAPAFAGRRSFPTETEAGARGVLVCFPCHWSHLYPLIFMSPSRGRGRAAGLKRRLGLIWPPFKTVRCGDAWGWQLALPFAPLPCGGGMQVLHPGKASPWMPSKRKCSTHAALVSSRIPVTNRSSLRMGPSTLANRSERI
jgi:hypothetical protein